MSFKILFFCDAEGTNPLKERGGSHTHPRLGPVRIEAVVDGTFALGLARFLSLLNDPNWDDFDVVVLDSRWNEADADLAGFDALAAISKHIELNPIAHQFPHANGWVQPPIFRVVFATQMAGEPEFMRECKSRGIPTDSDNTAHNRHTRVFAMHGMPSDPDRLISFLINRFP